MIRRVWNKLKQLSDLMNKQSDLMNKQSYILSINQLILRRLDTLAHIEVEQYLHTLFSEPKYLHGNRLEPYGLKVYSQCDEDGIIQEIFNRIGLQSSTFVEFGVQNGLENNTLKLLLEDWSGLWIEGNERYVVEISKRFHDVLAVGRLRVKAAFITRENINDLIGEYFRGEIDLLSIDIDGNDIHILASIDVITPRVIVIEYNGKFPPPINVAPRYDPEYRWSGSDYNGSSLVAITNVANRKGYSLVGCNVVGSNAFFVRNDLLGERFEAPFTADNHYQPTRYFLLPTFRSLGHPPDWGPYDAM
jgi:hypothetical protein